MTKVTKKREQYRCVRITRRVAAVMERENNHSTFSICSTGRCNWVQSALVCGCWNILLFFPEDHQTMLVCSVPTNSLLVLEGTTPWGSSLLDRGTTSRLGLTGSVMEKLWRRSLIYYQALRWTTTLFYPSETRPVWQVKEEFLWSELKLFIDNWSNSL